MRTSEMNDTTAVEMTADIFSGEQSAKWSRLFDGKLPVMFGLVNLIVFTFFVMVLAFKG